MIDETLGWDTAVDVDILDAEEDTGTCCPAEEAHGFPSNP